MRRSNVVALRSASGLLAAGLLAVLTGCGDLPRPFAGNPGATARRLAQPPPSRLAVAPPTAALLTDKSADALSHAVADALVAREIPAVPEPPKPGDWRLVMSAEVQQGVIVPTFAVLNPAGKPQGTVKGAPVPAALWATGQQQALQASADQAAPRIADLLDQIEAAREESDPQSLMNRPARLAIKGVSGAPGDGDHSLDHALRVELVKLDQTVLPSTDNADFLIEGKVHTEPAAQGQERVEVQWIVTDAQGRESGRVVQLNDVPPQAIEPYWGDVAAAVAQQAAGGIKEVVLKQIRKPPGPAVAGGGQPSGS